MHYLSMYMESMFPRPFVINNVGLVGIGTSVPQEYLHIFGGNAAIILESFAPQNNGAITVIGKTLAGISHTSVIDFIHTGTLYIVTDRDKTGSDRSIVFSPGNNNNAGRFNSDGIFIVGSATSTGTPNQQLQVSGGAYISCNLGIGTINPGEKLQVDGNIRVGISSTSNYIAFRGTDRDNQIPYINTYIGERIYETGSERSELVLYKGNDVNPGSGYDRIRLIGSELRFDTYASSIEVPGAFIGGTFEEVCSSQLVTNKMILTYDGNLGIGTAIPTSKLQVAGNVTPSVTNTYDLGTESLKWRKIYATTIEGNSDTATRLATPREIDISGDVIGVGIGTTFDGSRNVTIPTELSTTGVVAGTYGSSTTVGIVTVDSKGRITSASNVNIDFSKATYADNAGISTNLKGGTASQIPYQSAANTTSFIPNGTSGQLLRSNGTSAPSWVTATAAGGITIQEEGSNVGNQLGITTVNFIGGSVTATSPTAGTANINITAASDILVNQTGYGCANPVTVTGGNTINISSASNAYGTRYVQTTAPSSPCNGDVWYNPSGSSDSGFPS